MSNFDEYVDEISEPIYILGITLKPSQALKETDPIAYRCLKADFEEDE